MLTTEMTGMGVQAPAATTFDDYDIEIRRMEAVLRFYQRQTDGLLGKRHPRKNEGLRARFSIPTTPRDRVLVGGDSH
jgi:hypothetical protein